MTTIGASLNYKLTAALMLVLVLTSLVFLLLFFGSYHLQLQSERRQASEEVSHLLQASLENAMLKRDLPGLQAIVDRLGMQATIVDVSILNISGEVRFSSQHNQIGSHYSQNVDSFCPDCERDFAQVVATTKLLENTAGKRVFRSVNPVKNRQACGGCHGTVENNPVNGILIVDYDAEPIITKARSGILGLLFAGLIVMLLTVFTVGWFMRRFIIKPVKHLKNISEELAQGNLSARTDIKSKDELSELGNSFNLMAERLDSSLQQLLEKESYLQALIDAIPDSVRVIDENFKVVNANDAYCRQLQLTNEEAVTLSCFQASHQRQEPCVATLVTCPVVKIRENHKTVKTMQNFTNKSGEYSDVQVFAAALEIDMDGGNKTFVVESIRDLQRDINFSHEQKLSALGQLAAGVAHEIRNPLSSIRIALQSTIKKLKLQSGDQEDVMRYLQLVDGEIDKCVSITERLLKLSALPSEHKELVDINHAIEDTLSLLDYERDKSGIKINIRLDSSQPRTMAAESDIRMLFINLLQNAFHALHMGGVLDVVSEISEDEVTISFRDDGVGISSENKPHIFEPFFSRRADGKPGTGLGLTISRSIAERYDGSIRVKDVKPNGTEFIVSLPLVMESDSGKLN